MQNNAKVAQDQFWVPADTFSTEMKVKGSKFISQIVPVATKKSAEQEYSKIKNFFYDATHNCFAYIIDEHTYRFSDDGEPSGTAGRPIYEKIKSAGVLEVLCVITRYFGGTKLGTGGLVRAYSKGAEQVLQKMAVKVKVLTVKRTLIFNYDHENTVRRLLHTLQGHLLESDYSDRIRMEVAIPCSKASYFAQTITDLTHADVTIYDEHRRD
ncbi:MAG: DUF1949 domain-containing protein [Caldithrix sp.]|nr:DUF1949 domain-containing protein [Caldithrix sp.]